MHTISSEVKTEPQNFKTTRFSCYLAMVTQAAVVNIWPLLYVILQKDFSLSYTQLASLGLTNFAVQLCTDLAFAKAADKWGYKPFLILSQSAILLGFVMFAVCPYVLSSPYIGFIVSTVVFSLGGGLLEILISPLMDSIPKGTKSGSMAMLHSFYAWGQAGVILLTSLALFAIGSAWWQYIVFAWCLMPLACLLLFLKAPMPQQLPPEKIEGARNILKSPAFWLCFLIIFFGAGAECSMVQWSSAFMEQVVSLPKLLGDSGGVMTFALFLGTSRFISAAFSKKIKLSSFMIWSALAGIVCYMVVAVSNLPALSLIACGLTGFASGMLWPGTLVLASDRFPRGGAWLFAMMAVGGDSGAAFCPWFTGLIADNAAKLPVLSNAAAASGLTAEQFGLRMGMAVSALYPLLCAVALILLVRLTKKEKPSLQTA